VSGSESTAGGGGRHVVRSARSWGGYIWFMSFGTFLPLPVFLAGYVAQLTFIGAPLARQLYRSGIFLSTLGQRPPGADRLEARRGDEPDEGEEEEKKKKKPFAERIRDKAPPGWVERRDEPFGMRTRTFWFILVGWWLGALWAGLAWSVLLLPYPFPDLIRKLLADLPSVMTLAPPQPDARRAGS
jgi:uncharacterized membrane protein YccF (DUF307 family)